MPSIKSDSAIFRKSAVELIEESFFILKKIPAFLIFIYYAGSVPFIIGLLFYWADMSRGAGAENNVLLLSGGLAVLFIWMKICQSIFCVSLGNLITGESVEIFKLKKIGGIILATLILQTVSPVVLLFSLFFMFPFPWFYSFFQNLHFVNGKELKLKELIKISWKFAVYLPGQNSLFISIIFLFSFFVFLNFSAMFFMTPYLLQFFTGWRFPEFSPFFILNSTFLTIICGLTYLVIDPFVKIFYSLRCFYCESAESGLDLKIKSVELFKKNASLIIIPFLIILFLNVGDNIFASPVKKPPQEKIKSSEFDSNSKMLLDSIEATLAHPKYSWREPRGKSSGNKNGMTYSLGISLKKFISYIKNPLKNLFKKLKKIFSTPKNHNDYYGDKSFFEWIKSVKFIMLAISVFFGLLIFTLTLKILRSNKKKKNEVSAADTSFDNISFSGNITADKLPSAEWLELARKYLDSGDLKLAMRAFFLAVLSSLNSKGLIVLRTYKTNFDYNRELKEKGNSFQNLFLAFSEASAYFDRIWYGDFEIADDKFNDYATNINNILENYEK
ncbi:MAG TPA: hypothetical protein PKY81_05935 [bacterium]|nr:hypothetical protein [bacterium]HPN30479.1 hypothetical protein [bacterium]